MPDDKQKDGPKVIDGPTIDPSSFRVSSTDTKGHSQRMWFKCQPGHAAMIDAVVQSNKFPYRTKGDLLRHALVRHLRWLENLQPIPSITGMVDAILTILRDDEFYSDYKHVLETLSNRINMHKGQGELGEARRILYEVLHNIKRMPDTFWRDKYLAAIDRDHGDLIKNAPKASLLHFIEEKEDTVGEGKSG